MPTRRSIEISHLVKRYAKAERNSVDDVSFYVEEGAFFSLLGPNGAGKTTTLSILTTTLAATSGSVKIAGFDVATQSDKVRQQIGVIFQNPSLDLNLTAEENIRFHAILYHLYPFVPSYALMPQAYKQKVHDLASILGMENELHKPVKNLSGGMKRKLEIIRSLMHQPKVLFLDEPTTGLDPISRQSLWQYLKEIREKEGITIFLTTHYLEEAEGSDYLCIIDQGKIVSEGTPAAIKEHLIKRYLTVDAENRKALTKELSQLKLKPIGTGPFKIELAGDTGQHVIQSLKTPLNFLDIHNPTLEEAYVEILGNSHEPA